MLKGIPFCTISNVRICVLMNLKGDFLDHLSSLYDTLIRLNELICKLHWNVQATLLVGPFDFAQ